MNVALNKPSAQSSYAFSGVSSRVLDGNINPAWGGGIPFITYYQHSIMECDDFNRVCLSVPGEGKGVSSPELLTPPPSKNSHFLAR